MNNYQDIKLIRGHPSKINPNPNLNFEIRRDDKFPEVSLSFPVSLATHTFQR